jgi:hypothetical protein
MRLQTDPRPEDLAAMTPAEDALACRVLDVLIAWQLAGYPKNGPAAVIADAIEFEMRNEPGINTATSICRIVVRRQFYYCVSPAACGLLIDSIDEEKVIPLADVETVVRYAERDECHHPEFGNMDFELFKKAGGEWMVLAKLVGEQESDAVEVKIHLPSAEPFG